MKMVKSLLLISAAGLVAVSGAQAADLPVKAKPVEYVKVCSLYGAGFYYIPGTDICMKVGGYVRYQVGTGLNGNFNGPWVLLNGINNRTTASDVLQRARGLATFDTRQQTTYGTLRTYLLFGFNQDSNVAATTAPPTYATRAFIQLAGFTFGKATSYFDFVSNAAVSYHGTISSPDTGDAGQFVAAYTAQLGNGVSASISMEMSRRLSTVYAAAAGAPYTFAATPLGSNLGSASAVANLGVGSRPDIVANLRVDQAWGSAQVSAALHDVSATYYGTGIGGAAGSEGNGHPGDKWGWAVSAGLRLNAPMFGPGDYFQGAVVYAQGASRYASNTPGGSNIQFFSGNTVGFLMTEDAVFGGTATTGLNGIELTTSWSVMASYEHFWTPSLRTSVWGSYYETSHNANATTLICATGAAAGVNYGATCNPDGALWNIGSRSQWNITKDLYVGVDVMYWKINSASFNSANTPVLLTTPGGATLGKPTALYTAADQDGVSAIWRIHRDIVP